MQNKEYITKLKRRRQAAGLSQSQLAEKSDVNVRMIQHYEQGAKPIDKAQVGTVIRLAAALNCSIPDILENWQLVVLAKKLNK